MRILADRAIPFLRGVLEPFAEVEYIDGNAFTKEKVADANETSRNDKAIDRQRVCRSISEWIAQKNV